MTDTLTLPDWMVPPAPALTVPDWMTAPATPALQPDLSEPRRLLAAGMKLVKLVDWTKQPSGTAWNDPSNYATTIDPTATGYGMQLTANGLVSVDPDNLRLATLGMAALGFDLEEIMQAGARTRSTRNGSGGRAIFRAPAGDDVEWIKFAGKTVGTVLELRATSPNLQDVVAGLVYRTKDGQLCTQQYVNELRPDTAPELPEEFLKFWQRCSTDLDYLHEVQKKFMAACGEVPNLAISGRDASGKISLAFRSQRHSTDYNAANSVESILERHGYKLHRNGRWECPTASGQPGIRQIPGKDGLWRSDHASDPLTGTFDAWLAHVVLDFGGDLAAAEREHDTQRIEGMFSPVPVANAGAEMAGYQHEVNLDLLELASQQKGQDAAAVVFAERQRGQLLYVVELRTWFVRGEFVWMPDRLDGVRDLIRKTVRALNPQAKAAMGSANFANGVLSFAAADPVFARSQTQFDTDNYVLNTPGQTIDLRSGKRWANRPDDLLMKCTAVAPTDEMAPVFTKFMDEITLGDTELQTFLQVSLGACLSGAIEAHWLMFWIGSGRNGKNTLGDLVEWIMGNYSVKIPASTLMQQRNEGHPTELATLRGVRLATSSEVQDGAHWHESRINELTGDATIAARVMRGDFFTFTRTHKHVIYGNHRPQIRATTQAVRQRLKIVPFRASFAGREDPNLPDKLRAEAGAVLSWLIDGHAQWLALGKRLPKCAAVEAESADYFESQGSTDAWMAERCETDPTARTSTAELYQNFVEWKRGRGEVAESQTRFGEGLSSRFSKYRSMSARGFVGIRLAPNPMFIQTG